MMDDIMGKVENFPHAPRYELPEGMNPADMPNPHYMTPDEMRERGIRRVE